MESIDDVMRWAVMNRGLREQLVGAVLYLKKDPF
jgi:hypothetical protein